MPPGNLGCPVPPNKGKYPCTPSLVKKYNLKFAFLQEAGSSSDFNGIPVAMRLNQYHGLDRADVELRFRNENDDADDNHPYLVISLEVLGNLEALGLADMPNRPGDSLGTFHGNLYKTRKYQNSEQRRMNRY